MRIVGGEFRGRLLRGPGDNRIRPTADRVRESLFNLLARRVDLRGLRVMDLFAGTGALGLEAVSRGAAAVLFVDRSAAARALCHDNIERLGLEGRARLLRRDATRLGVNRTLAPFDLAFADPPYGAGLGEKAAASLVAGGWLADDAWLVLEEERASAPARLAGFATVDRRQYGDTEIGLFRREGRASREDE